MPCITIHVNAAFEPMDEEILTFDLPPGLTIANLKTFLEAETKFPASTQHIFLNGHVLGSDDQTLEQVDVRDGEMLAMVIIRQSMQGKSRLLQGDSRSEAREAESIEATRRRLLEDPGAMSQLVQCPGLAAAIHDPNEFKDQSMAMKEKQERVQMQRAKEIALLNEDMFNAEAQKKIEELIRMELIMDNLQYAYENNPEVFTPHTIPYVEVKVNGHPIKAMVNSGVDIAIMSSSCAQTCGIHNLIDWRYSGMAYGVGKARMLGRVHNVKFQIGDTELDCEVSVIQGQDVDVAIGLDILRRHQACIDLLNNKLRFPHTEVPFLDESEIPKLPERGMVDEPMVQGLGGTEISTNIGTVRPAGSSAAAE